MAGRAALGRNQLQPDRAGAAPGAAGAAGAAGAPGAAGAAGAPGAEPGVLDTLPGPYTNGMVHTDRTPTGIYNPRKSLARDPSSKSETKNWGGRMKFLFNSPTRKNLGRRITSASTLTMVTWLRTMLKSWAPLDTSKLRSCLDQFRLSVTYRSEASASCIGPILRFLSSRNIAIDEALLEILLKDALLLGYDDNVEFVCRHVMRTGGLEHGRCLWMAVWYGHSACQLLGMIERGFVWTHGYTKQELERFVGTRADPVLSLVKSKDRCVEIAQVLSVLGFPFDAAREYANDNWDLVDLTPEMSSFIHLGHDERTKRTAWMFTAVKSILDKLHPVEDRIIPMATCLMRVAEKQQSLPPIPIELWRIIAEQTLRLNAWHGISYDGLHSFMSK